MAEVEVAVVKGGRVIDRLRSDADGTGSGAVRYRGRLWAVVDGRIDLDSAAAVPSAQSGAHQAPPSGAAIPLDEAQAAVVDAAPHARVLVDAGPGTGKTHVACARVAMLISEGIPAPRIWLISFTRTAVVEIRNRIAAALAEPADAASVRVATLDSHAWALQSGFSADADLRGGFDENISRTLERVGADDDLRDYLGRIRHVVVDEAQDIVGARAELVLAIIGALDPDCGVTVFADEAQAIYGFTEDAGATAPGGPTLPQRLRAQGFEDLRLTHVHRTEKANLRSIFTAVRSQVLRRSGSLRKRRERVEHEILRLADEDAGERTDLRLEAAPDGALVLTRNRAEVLLLSGLNADTPHRLRMSGLPPVIRPWVATLLWDCTAPRLTRQAFDELWAERLPEGAGDGGQALHAWSRLVDVAGQSDTSIDMRRLRDILSRASPPMVLCTPEFGAAGPILGTIHASKGREAAEVTLFLPADRESGPSDGLDPEEEIRLLFVGATRAREHLRASVAASVRAGAANGRSWRTLKPKRIDGRLRRRIQVEFGRIHDIDAAGLVGRRAFSDADDALEVQNLWRATPCRKDLHARAEAALDWNLVLEDADDRRLAVLGQQIRTDLREIAQRVGTFPPPGFFPFLRSGGLRTLAVHPEDPLLEELHEPWRSSGFVLAPLLTGFSPATFPGA